MITDLISLICVKYLNNSLLCGHCICCCSWKLYCRPWFLVEPVSTTFRRFAWWVPPICLDSSHLDSWTVQGVIIKVTLFSINTDASWMIIQTLLGPTQIYLRLLSKLTLFWQIQMFWMFAQTDSVVDRCLCVLNNHSSQICSDHYTFVSNDHARGLSLINVDVSEITSRFDLLISPHLHRYLSNGHSHWLPFSFTIVYHT